MKFFYASEHESPDEFNHQEEDMPPGFDEYDFPFALREDAPISMYDEPVECNYVPAKTTPVDAQAGGGFQYSGKRRRSFKRDVTDPGMILGPAIHGEPVSISSVNEEVNGVVFEGIFVSLEMIETKTGKGLIKGHIVDATNSIRFAKFTDTAEEGEELLKTMNGLKAVRVQGDVHYDDKFERDYTLVLRSIQQLESGAKRTENREDSRVELHLHTKMSDRDALVNVKELLQTVKAWGHPAVAITDHGVIQAFPEAQEVAGKLGVKVIYGVEGYLIEDEENDTRAHIILLAKNRVGLRNLYKMISISHLQYYKRRPRLPRAVIEDHREGIIIGSACEAGELIRAIIKGESQERLLEIASFYDYLEIQPLENNQFLMYDRKTGEKIHDEQYLIDINKKVVELGELLNKPVVATCDVHFLDPEDEIYRRIIMAGQGFKDADEQAPLFLRTTEEMLKEFAYLGSEKAEEVVITNTNRIADMCEKISPVRPDKCPPVIENSDQMLRDICYNKAHKMYGDPLPEIVQERLDRELNSIISNGYAVMYIIAQKLVWKSNDDGYLVGSRGSVGSSFVATMAGITEVNPLSPHYYCSECHYSDFDSEEVRAFAGGCGFDMPDKNCPNCGAKLVKAGFDIPFETFLGFKGDKEPDIDLNFSGDYQAKAHRYTEVIFGEGHTFKAGTIGTLADKTAFGYVKNYYEERGHRKRKCEIDRILQGCTGIRRSTGQHPGGIVVLPHGHDINEFTPVQHPANDMTTDIITTHFDYHSIDHNLLKLDILGHDDPTMIRTLEEYITSDALENEYNDENPFDATKIPLDDKKVLSLFHDTSALGIKPEDIDGCNLGCLGIPEFGTDFVIQMVQDANPQSLSDLIRISGLSHGTNVWLGNAQVLIESGKATISTAICTRDDIMIYLINQGVDSALSFTIMESVRKGKGLKPEWEEAMKEKDVPDWYIWSCKQISYMFPKAHAAAYVMMAYRIAYCKINYPLAYYGAYFGIRANAFSYELMCQGKDKLNYYMKDYKRRSDSLSNKEQDVLKDMKIVQEMYARGYEFLPLDIYKAKATKFQIIDGKLMPPLSSIEGMGEKAAEAVEEAAKDGPYLSLDDFRQRTKVSKTVIEFMSDLGLFGNLPQSNQLSLFDF